MTCLPQFRTPMTIVHTHKNGTKDTYLRQEELGHGGFAIVYRVIDQRTNQEYALKVISKERYEGPKGKKSLEKLNNEISIQRMVNHPNIVKSYGSFSDEFNYYILLEYCPGKTVYDILLSSENGHLDEAETRKILQDVIRAVIYLHRKHIIHRDLKLENYMIGVDGSVKIADFGISVVLKHDDEKRFSLVGTPNYLSPEVLQKVNKGYGYEVDIWSIGVCAFMMLTGHPPFEGYVKRITFEHIKNCDYHFPPNIQISESAKDFVRTILKIDPNRRPTVIDLANHPFMTTFSTEIVHLYKPSSSSNSFFDNSFNQFGTKTNNISKPRIPLPPTSTKRTNFISNVPTSVKPRFPYQSTTTTTTTSNYITSKFTDDTKDNKFNESIKSFTIPNCFVSRLTFHDRQLGYLLENGIVGVCMNDHSRIVMDPNEKFVQYYRNYSSFPEVINLEKEEESIDSVNEDLHKKISLVQRISRILKTNKQYYQIDAGYVDSFLPLKNVKYFLNKNNTILFKFDDKNVQVNFNDHSKLVIFHDTQKMCIVKSMKDKCRLMNVNNVLLQSPSSYEFQKYMKAKELLSDLKT